MALTAQEMKWFKSFMKILREKGMDTSNRFDLLNIVVFQDVNEENEYIENHAANLGKGAVLPEDIKNMAFRGLRKKSAPAFIRPEDTGEIMIPVGQTDEEAVDWIYDRTMMIDETRMKEDGSGLDAEMEAKVKALYENAKLGRLYYCQDFNSGAEVAKCIYVDPNGDASIMERSIVEMYGNDMGEENLNELNKLVAQVDNERRDFDMGIPQLDSQEIEDITSDLKVFAGVMKKIIMDQKANPQQYVTQDSAKRRALSIGATRLTMNLENLVYEESKNLRNNSDYTFGVMPLRSTQELGHPELNPVGVYTSFDADIKCELKNINDAMQFKGQAARDYVQKLQNSELFTNAMASLNRISEQIRAYESIMQRLPEQKKEEKEYLKGMIHELTVPEARKNKIGELENKIANEIKSGVSRNNPSLSPLYTLVDDLKNMDKLTHLVDVCSYLSCRKTRSTDDFKDMGNLSDELSNYMSENLPEWMPDEQVLAAAADWEIPESFEIDFDDFTNTIIHDGIHMPEMEGLSNEQKLSRIQEGLKNPESAVYKEAQEKLGDYIEGIVTERFKSLGMNMSLYMVPFNDCVIIDGKLVSDMFMDDNNSPYAFKEGQKEVAKKQERQYLAEQLGKAFQTGRSVEIFLPDKDGKFVTTTKITAKGLAKEGIEAKEVDEEALLQAKGKFFVEHYGNLKGISEPMQEKLKIARAREMQPNQYAIAAVEIREDMRREKASEYNIFTRGDNGRTAAEQVSGLLRTAQEAQKSVWFGSSQYEEMVQAMEKLNQLTEKLAGNIDPDNLEQMHEYKQALEEVREKADAYVEYKRDDDNPKPKTQKRIDTARGIRQYTDDMLRSVDRTMKKKVEEINRDEDYVNEMRHENMDRKYEAIKALYNQGRQATTDTALRIKDPEFARSLHVGGMVGRADRVDSVAANWLEYYRQTHNLSTGQLLDVVYNQPEELQSMAEDYRAFMKQNAVFNSNKDKLFPTPEVKAHIQAQANFYKNWYNNLINTPIIDYFELDNEECMKQIISDTINTINCSQNEQDIRKGYVREYVDAFGGPEEMNRLQRLAGIRQAVAHCADDICNPQKDISQRVGAKIVYGKLMEICKDRMPYEVPEEVTFMGLSATNVSSDLMKKFSSEELKKYFDDTASPELKGKIETAAAASMDELKELRREAMKDNETREQKLEDNYQKEVCAQQLYDMLLKRLSVRKAEDSYAAMHTAEGRNEFLKLAVTSNVVERMQNNPDLINQKGHRLVDELIAEMQPKKEIGKEAERGKEVEIEIEEVPQKENVNKAGNDTQAVQEKQSDASAISVG